MAEGSRGGPACGRMEDRQDPAPSSGGCGFPEYELPELNTRAFHVGAFGELWRCRLRGKGDLSLKEPPAPAVPEGDTVADSGREDAAVARDLGCSLEAAAELRAVCGLDKLKCLEEGEDPEVIPENTDLVTLGVQKFLGQGLNPCHSSDPGHISDSAGFLTCRTTRNSETLRIFFTSLNPFVSLKE